MPKDEKKEAKKKLDEFRKVNDKQQKLLNDLMKMQQSDQTMKKQLQMMSQIMKKQQDTAKAIINNLK